jgi:hypothetical protein
MSGTGVLPVFSPETVRLGVAVLLGAAILVAAAREARGHVASPVARCGTLLKRIERFFGLVAEGGSGMKDGR